MSRASRVLSSLLPVIFLATAAPAATVDFELVAAGTQYGNAYGHLPGDVVLSQSGIQMSVETFYISASSYSNLYEAEVTTPGSYGFTTQTIWCNNISVQFDLTNLGFTPGDVRIEYADYGGTENISVNGGTIYELNLLSSVPAAIAPNVTAHVTETSVAGGVKGVVTLTGPVQTLLVGGQEFEIDNLDARAGDNPDPIDPGQQDPDGGQEDPDAGEDPDGGEDPDEGKDPDGEQEDPDVWEDPDGGHEDPDGGEDPDGWIEDPDVWEDPNDPQDGFPDPDNADECIDNCDPNDPDQNPQEPGTPPPPAGPSEERADVRGVTPNACGACGAGAAMMAWPCCLLGLIVLRFVPRGRK
jgi:hypothetical protein